MTPTKTLEMGIARLKRKIEQIKEQVAVLHAALAERDKALAHRSLDVTILSERLAKADKEIASLRYTLKNK